MNQLAFLDNKQMRDENIERLEVLNQVGELLLLPNSEYSTTKQVAEYYCVDVNIIQSYSMNRNGYEDYYKELVSDGMISKTYKETLKILGNRDINLKDYGVGTRGSVLFTRKSVLKLALFLRESEVAIKIRTILFGRSNIRRVRNETEVIFILHDILKELNMHGIRQYKVGKYYIDYYIPNLNMAIEYDEGGHKYYTYEQHEGRQRDIEKELGCKFIRVTDEYDYGTAIGIILKEILNKIMSSKNKVINLKDYGIGVEGDALFLNKSILESEIISNNSKVGRELRTRLLNAFEVSSETVVNNGNIALDNVVEEIDKEKELMTNIGIAICSGDMTKVMEAQTLYNNFMNEKLKNSEGIRTDKIILREIAEAITNGDFVKEGLLKIELEDFKNKIQ